VVLVQASLKVRRSNTLQSGWRCALDRQSRHFNALFSDSTTLSTLSALRVPSQRLTGEATRPGMRRLSMLMRSALPSAVHFAVPGTAHMGPMTHANVNRLFSAFLGWQVAMYSRSAAA
jgi:hypothetical protein